MNYKVHVIFVRSIKYYFPSKLIYIINIQSNTKEIIVSYLCILNIHSNSPYQELKERVV